MDAAARRSPKKSLSVEDGRRLLNQYRLLKWKAENSTHQNLVNELQNKIVGLEEAFADITLEADERRLRDHRKPPARADDDGVEMMLPAAADGADDADDEPAVTSALHSRHRVCSEVV